MTHNLDGLLLLLHALEQEGRKPTVISRSDYESDKFENWPTDDYVMVEDDTWRAYMDAIGYP